jgi:hypothetical protein
MGFYPRTTGPVTGDRDALFDRAAEVCIAEGSGSTSLLQRKLQIGYVLASTLIDQLLAAGVLGPPTGTEPREVLVGSVPGHGSAWPADDSPPPVDGELRSSVEMLPPPFSPPASRPSRSMVDRFRNVARTDLLDPAIAWLLKDCPPTRVSAEELRDLTSELGIAPSDIQPELLRVWEIALKRLCSGTVPLPLALGYLQALARAFGLSQSYPEAAREQILYVKHRPVLTAAMQGPELTADDRAMIARSVEELGLSEEDAKRLMAETALAVVTPEVNRILAAKQATDEEALQLFNRVAALGGELPTELYRQIVFCVYLSRLERGEFPVMKLDFALPESETCHYAGGVLWLENRRDRGVDTLTVIDRGLLVITNTRVLFNGEKKSITLKLGTLLGAHLAESPAGGELLVLVRDKGRKPHLHFVEPLAVEVAERTINLLLRPASDSASPRPSRSATAAPPSPRRSSEQSACVHHHSCSANPRRSRRAPC